MKEKQLQQIIAAAMYSGSLLAEQNYGGELDKISHQPFAGALMKLKQLTTEFTVQNNLEAIEIDKVFPIHGEIEELLNFK